MASKTPKLISLFSGAGGLDLGMEAAGFETAVAVEMNARAVETLQSNRSWAVIPRDIHDVSSAEILARSGLEVGEADLLIGGPPCQPFSKSGFWISGDTERLEDPRAGTLIAYLRVLRDTLPKTFLLENVPGLAFKKKSEGLLLIAEEIQKINTELGTSYSLAVGKLNAADYGVPQLRERVFVIGSRRGGEFVFPPPTHRDPNDSLSLENLEPYRTAWDAIGDLESQGGPELNLRGKWADLLPTIPEGENYLWHTDRGGGEPLFGWRRRYWSFLLKLSKRRPSWTLQAQPGPAIGPFHWRNRRLSPRELCRLQTFPDGFDIVGSLGEIQRQLGNAVPSALAEMLGRQMRNQFFGSSLDTRPTLVPRPRRQIPEPSRTRAVPQKYMDLVGDHEAHPGTGLGYSAQRRKLGKSPEDLQQTKSQIALFSP